MTVSVDPRVRSVQALLTGPRLLTGDGDGLLRVPAIARLIGCPLAERGALVAWLKDRDLIADPDYTGPLSSNPDAGTVSIPALRRELLAALKKGALPFTAVHLEVNPNA